MKKKFFCALLLVVLCFAAQSFADVLPPSIILSNIMKAAGGNDFVYVQEFDYSKQDYDLAGPNPDTSITIITTEWSDKQVAKNSVPSRRNKLLNPHEPVEIISYGNKINVKVRDLDGVRVLDDKGNVVADWKITQEYREVDFVITPEAEEKTYYIEFEQHETKYNSVPSIGFGPFSVPLGNTKTVKHEYCYVLARIKAERESRTYDQTDEYKALMEQHEATEKYMKEHNIKSYEDLTVKDLQKIYESTETKTDYQQLRGPTPQAPVKKVRSTRKKTKTE